jgi:hypothetical protein
VKAGDINSLESSYDYSTSTYLYENRLTFVNSLTAKDYKNNTLNNNDWAKPNSTVHFSGLRVVYYGTTNIYPINSDFDVHVINNESQAWNDTSSSGRNIAIDITTTDATNTGDMYIFSIINIPTGGADLSNTSFTIKTDKIPPVINYLTSTTYPDNTVAYDVTTGTFNWSATDNESGIKGIWYLLDNTSNTSNDLVITNGTNTNAGTATITDIANGIWYLHLVVEDNCDNVSSTSYMFKVDAGIPDIVAITGLYNNVWQNIDGGPVISWTNPNSLTGDTYYITTDGTTPSSSNYQYTTTTNTYDLPTQVEGKTTIKAIDENGKGIYSIARTFTIKYDITAPIISSVTSDTYPNSSVTYTTSTGTFTWSVTDDLSGVKGVWYLLDNSNTTSSDAVISNGTSVLGSSLTLSNIDNGTWYLHLAAQDNCENTSISSYSFKIDVPTEGNKNPDELGIVSKIVQSIPISDQASQNITAATLAVITVTPAVSVGLGSSYMIASIIKFFSGLLVFFKIGHKKRNCGLVYDSTTKEPIRNVVVRFYNIEGALAATEVTNVYGIFETGLNSGEYRIMVQASGYKFPTSLIAGDKDLPYENIYRGEAFNYDSSIGVDFSIPMDPLDKNMPEYAGTVVKNWLSNSLVILSNILIIFGFVFSVVSYLKVTNILNLVLLLLYVTLLIVNFILSRENRYGFGTVKDTEGNLEKNFTLGLMETQFGTISAKRISNSKGKYRFIVPGGAYKLVSLDSSYDLANNDLDINTKEGKITSIAKDIVITRRV